MLTNSATLFFLRNFIAALLEAEWEADTLRMQAAKAWPAEWRGSSAWPLTIHSAFPDKPSFAQLFAWIISRPSFANAVRSDCTSATPRKNIHLFDVPVEFLPPKTPTFAKPKTAVSKLALCKLLHLSYGQLTCYSDLKRLRRFARLKHGKSDNYICVKLQKHHASTNQSEELILLLQKSPELLLREGNFADLPIIEEVDYSRVRLLEIPKPRLMAVQRRIYADILALLPTHDAAHGFVPGRSILTNAALHVGRGVVIRFDLKDFFPSVPATRVRGIFARLGYPQEVSRLLMGLCTTVSPAEGVGATELYARPHLPQGAPTSPALANLAAYRLDCRLAGLAKRFGATYTRYADDLTFSGGSDLRRAARRLQKWVVRIVTEEGFTLNAAKTRVKSAADRQTVTGLVVNAKPNVRRRDFDRLKATLTNCVRHGPASQNREKHADFRSHLMGRVAFVSQVNPARGAKLRKLFDAIAWPASA